MHHGRNLSRSKFGTRLSNGRLLAVGVAVASALAACSPINIVTEGTGTPVSSDGSYDHVDLPGLADLGSRDAPANDSSVATGTLDNGLRYFVQDNDNPGGSAELRLAINAGSVDEQGPTGVAHFVEHMMFNGTEEYPKNELVDVLRGFGAAFGADVNAYTSFDQTVYELNVPSNPAALSTGLDVLSQWLSHATFDPAEVEAERGVVLDEWRSRTQTPDGRLFQIAVPLYYRGTPYVDRITIGSSTDIESVTAAELREFYEQWYRPENAAVIVVGQIDVDAVVDELTELFGDATDPDVAEPDRPDTSLDGRFSSDTPPGYALHADPDQPTVNVEVGLPLAALPADDPLASQAAIYDRMIYDILIRRLRSDIDGGSAPFDEIGPGTNSFTANMDAPALFAYTDAARSTDTMNALLDEYERAARYGFDDQEIAVAVSSAKQDLDSLNDGAESTQDVVYANRLVDHVIDDAPYPSITDEYRANTAIVDAVTPAALRDRFLARWTNTAPYLIVSVPERDAAAAPTEADFTAAVAALPTRDLAPREAASPVADELMAAPQPAVPDGERKLLPNGGFEFFDPIEYTYPNGVRVIINRSQIVEGQVFMSATSVGGRSVLDRDQIPAALYAPQVVLDSGVGELGRSEVADAMAAADISISASIDSYTEGFAGTFAGRDAEMALAYLHQLMTAPHADDAATQKVLAANRAVVDDPSIDADLVGFDALVDARYGDDSPEMVLPTKAEFATIDSDAIAEVWNDRFSNADGWVFVFSGDLDPDAFAPLADTYLGTLASSGPDREPTDISGSMPDGVTNETVQGGTGETAQTTLLFETPISAADAKTQATLQIANSVVDARLVKVVREEFGESYSPFSRMMIDDDPDLVSVTFVAATGAPDSMDHLRQLIVEQIADLAANGPTSDEFDKALAETTEQYNYVNNNQFIDALTTAALDPARDLDTYLGQFAEVRNVTSADVQVYVATHLPADNYISVTVLPSG